MLILIKPFPRLCSKAAAMKGGWAPELSVSLLLTRASCQRCERWTIKKADT